MRIVVTGGAGFIGSALVRSALASGHDVFNIDKLTYASNPASLADGPASGRYTFLKADICDRAAMQQAVETFRPDVLYNLAAETHVDRSIDGPDAFIRTNINGVHTLLEACRAAMTRGGLPQDFRFVQVSTDEVFGSIAEGAFDETSPYQPSSPYSASKASADHLLRAWNRTFGFPGILTNCSNNYGPWQFPEKFIPTIILKALRGEEIPVYGDGQQVRDWLFVDDHAGALLKVGAAGRTGETYCIGGGSTVANLDLARIVADRVDVRLGTADRTPSRDLIGFTDDRPGHDRRYAINHDKITRELGWRPAATLETGIARTVDWYLDHQDWLDELASAGLAGKRFGLIKGGLA